MAARVPIAQAGEHAVRMAADFAVEEKSGLVPMGRDTLTRVGYLRRVPDYIIPILQAAWPWTTVAWTTEIKTVRRRYFGPPMVQKNRVIQNVRVCFPLVYLEAFIAFLRPTGKCHLAPINKGISLDPEAVVELDDIPDTDPDF